MTLPAPRPFAGQPLAGRAPGRSRSGHDVPGDPAAHAAATPNSVLRLRSWAAPLAVFLGVFALYATTRSISLDDFDSFNFARAIDHFDPTLNQPQPPGYPVYVLLARLFDLAVGDHQLALTLLSSVCGAVAVLALYGLARDFDAGWAAAPLAVMPLFWLSAGMALSDVPGLAFAIVAVFLLHRARRDLRWLIAGCAVTGLTLGLRPQDAIVPLSVACLAAPRWIAAAREQSRVLLAALTAFVLACLAWAVPLFVSAGGLQKGLALLLGQSQYVGATDSLLSRPLTLGNVQARLAEFGSVFSAYFGGPANGGLPAFVALCGAVVVLALLAPRVRWLALSWLAPYAVFMVLFLRPDDPRKVLPAIPPLLLLLAGVKPRLVARLGALGLTGWFVFSAVPLVATLDSVKAPPEQAAVFIREAFSPDDTLVLAGASYNAVRYRDPAFKTYLLDQLDSGAVSRDLSSGRFRNLVLLDKEGFTPPENYVGVSTRTFERDPLVLPKASTVWLAAYRPLSELRERDLELPAEAVQLGTPEDVRYVLEGWYRPEVVAGTSARWTDKRAMLRFWLDGTRDATLHLAGIAYPAHQHLIVLVNGQQVGSIAMGQDWAPYAIPVPASALRASAINTITLQHDAAISAFDATHGQSLDQRPLAAAYSSFELTYP